MKKRFGPRRPMFHESSLARPELSPIRTKPSLPATAPIRSKRTALVSRRLMLHAAPEHLREGRSEAQRSRGISNYFALSLFAA